MFSLAVFRELVDYMYWGRDRILKAADGLTSEQLTAQTQLADSPGFLDYLAYVREGQGG